jgi:hypothetical protein
MRLDLRGEPAEPLTEESGPWDIDDDTVTLLADKHELDPEKVRRLIEELLG